MGAEVRGENIGEISGFYVGWRAVRKIRKRKIHVNFTIGEGKHVRRYTRFTDRTNDGKINNTISDLDKYIKEFHNR